MAKKQLYIINGSENEVSAELTERILAEEGDYVVVNLAESSQDAVRAVITKAYALLDLISFFTTGEDETRAWTITGGVKAPQAAGVIHTDFERKFIKAEVIAWDELLAIGSWSAARKSGKLRLEGKDYIVQDGDVMVIKHGG